MIRVLLADDQTLVRQGIISLLALTPDIRVTAEASDGEAALARLTESSSPFDVVLLDVRMPKKSGLDVLTVLRERVRPCPPTIILTTFDDDQVALAAVRLGATGYLLKDVSLEQLAGAVRAVARGETLHRPAPDRASRARAHRRPDQLRIGPPSAEPLTRRELQVLRLLANGSSNREIGEALGAAEGTIKNHLSSILSKLGVRDRTRAVLKALELGLLT